MVAGGGRRRPREDGRMTVGTGPGTEVVVAAYSISATCSG